MHHAVIHRKPDMIQFLLNAGAKRDVFDHNGNIPVRYTEIQAIKDLFTMPGTLILSLSLSRSGGRFAALTGV